MSQVSQIGSLNTTALVVPDLYVQIVPPQTLLINGVPSNVVGVVGTAAWGPVGQPMTVGSMAQYASLFGPVMPRKLGHAVLGTTDLAATQAFFVAGLGFKVSDFIKGAGAFLRCSTDHHNVLILGAPVPFLHHTSGRSTISTRSAGAPPRCSRIIRNGTSGAWAATMPAQTSSGI